MFARGETLKSDACLFAANAMATSLLDTRKAFIQCTDENSLLEWLFDEVDGTGFHGLDRNVHVAMAGHHDNRPYYTAFLKRPLHLQPVHFRHSNIKQNATL